MIYLDIDGVMVDFYGTAKKFGVELEHNKFGVWCWYGSDKCELCKDSSGALWDKCHLNFPTHVEFYAVADLQPWFSLLWIDMILTGQIPYLLSKDYAELKLEAIKEKIKLPNCDCNPLEYCKAFDAPDKSDFCHYPCDTLIDDNPEECERWRNKGGIAYWFNLAEENPFEKFLKWWRLGK